MPRHALLLTACLALLTACSTTSSDPRARSPGKVIDDQAIEWEVRRDIAAADKGFESGI